MNGLLMEGRGYSFIFEKIFLNDLNINFNLRFLKYQQIPTHFHSCCYWPVSYVSKNFLPPNFNSGMVIFYSRQEIGGDVVSGDRNCVGKLP